MNPGDKAAEEKFKDISEAYEVLSDPEKRKKYDSFGSQWQYAPAGGGDRGGFTVRPGGGTGQGTSGFEFDLHDLGDLFGGFFSGGGNRRPPAGPGRGEDLQYEIEVSLDESFRGGERRFTISAPDNCPTCHGTGAEPGSKMETCPQCKGAGRGRNVAGFTFDLGEPCDRCHGVGQVPAQPCHTCKGRGIIERARAVTVTVPKGVAEGSKLRVAGQGNPGLNGGPSGDLILNVRLKPNPIFERKGDDLYVELPVTFAEAALGSEVQVPTMTGKVTMKVPAGVQSGQQLRLGGQGMPRRAGGSGDLYARLKVTVPKNLTAEERALIEQLSGLRAENPRERILAGR